MSIVDNDKPKVLFHGTNIEVNTLTPQPITNEREKLRVHSNNVLYATSYFQEALVHAISKANDWEEHASYMNRDNSWTICMPVSSDEINKKSKVFIYKLPMEGFKLDRELNEWYRCTPVEALDVKTMTVGEALSYFDEIKYEKETEIAGGEKWI
jgi:hypothetical protein